MSVPVTAPRTAPQCLDLPPPMHAVTYNGRCLICLPQTRRAVVGYDDDGGETVIRQTYGRREIARDRHGRAR